MEREKIFIAVYMIDNFIQMLERKIKLLKERKEKIFNIHDLDVGEYNGWVSVGYEAEVLRSEINLYDL
jgi:hypothetical protein